MFVSVFKKIWLTNKRSKDAHSFSLVRPLHNKRTLLYSMTQYDRFYKLSPFNMLYLIRRLCYSSMSLSRFVTYQNPMKALNTLWAMLCGFGALDHRSTGPLIAGSIWFNVLHMATKICCAHPAFEPTHPRENSRSWRRLSLLSKLLAYSRSVYFRSLKLREYLSSDVASLSFRWRQRNAWLWLVQGPAVWLLLNVVWMKESLQSALNGLIT